VHILREGGIPEPVVEFSYTHHGTSVIEYFWHKCLNQGNPKELSENFFRYPGMRPRTKETAILMLVDAIEAASRTIDPPERERFEEMVNRIIFVKLRQGQLDESGLTIEDLRVMSKKLVDTLV
jgi:membrane-associated HD superfamily phosphohydrolase